MADVLVVADDLTGANAAAAGFARSGLRAVTAGAAEHPEVVAEMVARFDVVVASVDGRHEPPTVAAERSAAVVRAGWPARLVCNRIDTTLRGNVGATTAAVLAEVRELSDGPAVVLCAPAHPAAGRHTIGGAQLLEGVRLEDTEVARDARSPVRTSEVVEVLREQADLAAVVVPMATVTGPEDELVATLRQVVDHGADVVVADATTEAHLDRVARAAVAATAGTGVTWVATDPGPGSVALARAMGLDAKAPGEPLLVVSGSATELTRTQLGRVVATQGATVLRAPVGPGTAVPDADRTTSLLDEALEAAAPGEVIVLATVLDAHDVREVGHDDAEAIPRALARAVRRNLERHTVDGVFSTGGDVTAALFAELGSRGLEVTDEVEPLAVAGSVVGGPWDGLPMVTKGGLVGDADTTLACLQHLRRAAGVRRRQVAAAQSRTRP